MKRLPEILLLFFVLLFLGYHHWGYIGHYGYDDMEYAWLASDLTKGIFHPENHFSYRMTTVGFTALAYLFFGVSDFSSSLPAVSVTIAILWIVYITLRSYGNIVLTLGLSLSLFADWFIFYADKLMPDIYVALSVLAAVYVLCKSRFGSGFTKVHSGPLLLVLSLFFGFLSKGTILLSLPLFAFLFITDMVHRNRLNFWAWTWFYGLMLLGMYFLATYILTGNATARFDALYANSYLHQCSYDQQPLPILLDRIFKAFFERMFSTGMVTSYLFILPLLLSSRRQEVFRMNTPLGFFAACALILLLLANFMSISLSSYSPMCVDQRHYIYLVPASAIPAAMVIGSFLESKVLRWQILAVLFLAAAVAWIGPINPFQKLYAPLFVIFAVYTLLHSRHIYKWGFAMLFTIVLALIPSDMVRYAQILNYPGQRDVFYNSVVKPNPDWYIITDQVTAQVGDYYSGFDKDRNYTFLKFDEFDFDSLDGRRLIVYENRYFQMLSGLSPADLPRYLQGELSRHPVISEYTDLGIRILELDSALNLTGVGAVLRSSLLNFEGPVPEGWNKNAAARTDSIAYGGSFSEVVPEFSATFHQEMDSISLTDFDLLAIDAAVQALSKDVTSAVLVVSITAGDSTVFWEGHAVNKPMRAYGFWWNVAVRNEIPTRNIPAGAKLSVYVWNKERDLLFLDDFDVKLSGVLVKRNEPKP